MGSSTRSRSRQHGVTLPQGQAASWPGSETDPGSTCQAPPGKIKSWKDEVDLDVFILVHQWKDRQRRNVKVIKNKDFEMGSGGCVADYPVMSFIFVR